MSRTDRVIICAAIFLLIATVSGIYGYDFFFGSGGKMREGAVAELTGYQGDVRMKFTGDLAWQAGRKNQKLIYDDSVFSGPNSTAELKMGESKIQLAPNTLVVIRKDRNFSSLNITYGNVSGSIAKGDHFVIESKSGEKFELKGMENSKINIDHERGKIVLKVLEGNAQFVKDGKVQNLSSRDEVRLSSFEKNGVNPLVFVMPEVPAQYSLSESEMVEFAWTYTRADTQATGPFILEMSDNPSFTTIMLREELTESKFSTSLHFPLDIYYRVKDQDGNHSETRRLSLMNPKAPQILEPQENQAFESDPGQTYRADVVMTTPTFQSRARVEVAKDPQFQQVAEVRTGVESKYDFNLPVGKYYVRARLEYKQFTHDFAQMTSDWSNVRAFSIHEKLDLDRLAKLQLPRKVVVPNNKYASDLYSRDSRAREHLAQHPPFSNFFNEVVRPGHEIVMRNSDQPAIRRSDEGFPAAWIEPGAIAFNYQLESYGQITLPSKNHALWIEMAPPNDLANRQDGHLSWSPILFAKGYQVELKSNGVTSTFWPKGHNAKVPVEDGKKYAFRVRALGKNAHPISDWSLAKDFTPEIPRPAEVAPLAENNSQERDPASEQATNSIRMNEKSNLIQKAIAWIWAGTGVNFLAVRQTINNTADVEYKNTKSGSVFLEGGWWFWKRWGAAFSYKRTPGDIRVDNYPVSQRSFVWDTYTAELLYGLPWVTNIFGRQIDYGLRAGLQKHSFPFLFVDSGNSLVQSQSEMVAGSLGFFAETAGRWKFHWNMRYQQPISSTTSGGNTFKISPIVGFDGLVGTSYNLTSRLKTGMFWYGQLHNYKFNYQSATQNNVGEQTLFYSNWEARLGLDF